MLYIFFAPGFEETEAVVTLDMVRRGEIEIKSVGVGGRTITGSHGIPVVCDLADSELSLADVTGIILPGGMPGTLNLEKSEVVRAAIDHSTQRGLLICAICAAPSILGEQGHLKGKHACCYPGFEEKLTGAKVLYDPVVVDGSVITSRGAGTSIPFALAMVAYLASHEKAAEIAAQIQYG